LEKGRKSKDAQRKKAKKEGRPKAGDRWAKLLDGTLTVKDLDDQEVAKMRVRGADGGFTGKGRAIPSHLAQAFHQEAISRANDKLRTAAPEAVQALLDIGRDPDVKEGDRVRALMYVVDRALGKTPETVNIKSDDPWADLIRNGGTVRDARDLAALADEVVPSDLDEG
jgi:hypothetical protein